MTTSIKFPTTTAGDAAKVCPDGVPFCVGRCTWDADSLHGSDFASVPAERSDCGTAADVTVLATCDGADAAVVHVMTNLAAPMDSLDVELTPEAARQHAAHVLNAADMADPLPPGVLAIQAEQVRIGDEISSPGGWQKVVGQMAFFASEESGAQVNVWTDDYGHDPDTNGWEFQPGDVVHVRRRIHGSCAIQFVEPVR